MQVRAGRSLAPMIGLALAVAPASARSAGGEDPGASAGAAVSAASEPAGRPATRPAAKVVEVLDAIASNLKETRYEHRTRVRAGDGGFGHGTLLVLTDGAGQGIAYGWFGARSRGVILTPIAFGRLIK